MVCIRCVCVAYLLANGPGKRTCRWWRGCAEVAKTTCSQASGHYGKQDGHSYLKILRDWFEKCCFPVMYSLYALTSSFFHQLAWKMVIFSFKSWKLIVVPTQTISRNGRNSFQLMVTRAACTGRCPASIIHYLLPLPSSASYGGQYMYVYIYMWGHTVLPCCLLSRPHIHITSAACPV